MNNVISAWEMGSHVRRVSTGGAIMTDRCVIYAAIHDGRTGNRAEANSESAEANSEG